jgi:hypothetical protein
MYGCASQQLRTLEERGARVYVPRQDQDYAITVELRTLTLRHLVEVRDGLYAASPHELPILHYYANSIAHLLPSPYLPESGALDGHSGSSRPGNSSARHSRQ